jgi:hypothetical protein
MKTKNGLVFAIVFLASVSFAAAQSTPGQTQQKSLSSTMNVYVFPTEGQPAEQQSKEEAECYQWAVQNTGVDPFDLQKQAQQQQQQADQAQAEIDQAGQGAGVKGAVGGAAVGAIIGEIASDDAGKGAAYGAAGGAIIARRRTRHAKAEASEQVEQQSQQAQQATAEQIENFKKAFSVCLEAKDYISTTSSDSGACPNTISVIRRNRSEASVSWS